MAEVVRDDKLVIVEAPKIVFRADDGTQRASIEPDGSGTGLFSGSLSSVRNVPTLTQFARSVGTLDPSLARANNAPGPMTTPTPDGSGNVVEGHVLCFPQRWNGKRFWMAIGGYKNGDSAYENPILLCCDTYPDPTNAASQVWANPSGITNPLVPTPSGSDHNYDIGLAYDPTSDKLVIIYGVDRRSASNRYEWNYLLYDGTTVTGPFTLRAPADSTLSYTNAFNVFYDGTQWHGWAVSGFASSKNTIVHYTAPTLDQIQNAVGTTCTINGSIPSGRNLWEFNVTFANGHFIASMTTATNLSGNATDMHMMTSLDGQTWNFATNPILQANPTSGLFDSGQIYRGGIIPLQPDAQGRTRVGLYYTAAKSVAAVTWRMGYTEAVFGPQPIAEGTSFPMWPQTNDLFLRTDRNLLYFYDGARWLTVTQYVAREQLSGVSADTTVYVNPQDTTYDVWLEKVFASTYAATLSGTAYWTIALNGLAADNTPTTVTSFNQSADTQAVWTRHDVTVGALLSASGTFLALAFKATKTSTPGDLSAAVGYAYRLVG